MKTKEDIRREEEEKEKEKQKKKGKPATNPQDTYNKQFNSIAAEYLSKYINLIN